MAMAHEVRGTSPGTVARTGPSSPALIPVIRRESTPVRPPPTRFEPSGTWRTLLFAVGIAAALSLAFYCFLGSNVGGHRTLFHRR